MGGEARNEPARHAPRNGPDTFFSENPFLVTNLSLILVRSTCGRIRV